MKQLPFKRLLAVIALSGATLAAVAQPEAKDKVIKKDIKEKQQITITRDGKSEEKMVIEIDGDKVKVNGKDVADLKDINVHVSNLKLPRLRVYSSGQTPGNAQVNGNGAYSFDLGDDVHASFYTVDSNRAMLGVNTEPADGGVRLSGITRESAADKAGLKKGDVVTKINNRNIQEPGDVTDAIHSHKPGDKVTVTYLRDGKEQKATAELGRWKGVNVAGMATSPAWDASAWSSADQYRAYNDALSKNWNTEQRDSVFNRMQGARTPLRGFRTTTLFGSQPKLGLSVQDTDDGKGVKVLDADEDGNAAKAGVKENDIILQIDDKAVNSADELAAQMKAKKDQTSVKFGVQRDGKMQTIEVRIPKKLKTVDL